MASVSEHPAVEPVTPSEALTKLNRFMSALLSSRFGRRMGKRLMVLEFTGRNTGTTYRLPVGHQELLGELSVLTKRTWRENFRGGADARVRIEGAWRSARGTLVDDIDTRARAYADGIDRVGWKKTKNTLGLKINVGGPPTIDQLKEYVQTYGWYIIQFELGADA